MASSFLKKKAEEQAKRINGKYGASAYGGSSSLASSSKKSKDTDESKSKDTGKNDKKDSGKPVTRASDFLTQRAKRQAERIDKEYGSDAYGGTKSLLLDKEAGVKNWLNEMSSFSKRMGDDYSQREGKYQNAKEFGRYKTDTQATAGAMQNQADAYRLYFDANRDIYGDETVDSILKSLDEGKNYLSGIHTSVGDEYDYWSQWESEDAYNEYNRLTALDLNAAQKQLDDLTAQLDKAKKDRDLLLSTMGRTDRYGTPEVLERNSKALAEKEAIYKELNEQVAALNRDIYNATHYQDSAKYYSYMDAEDFNQYASTDVPAIRDIEYLSEDELRIYNYLMEKEGWPAARDYMEHLKEAINYRKGTERGEDIRSIENDLGRFLATTGHSAWSGLANFGRGIGQLFTDEMLATSATQYADAYILEDLSKNGWDVPGTDKTLGELGYEGLSTVTNMAPSILVGYATAGLGASAGVASAAASASMGLSAAGNAYTQALGDGYTKEQARSYATAVGASEAALQYVLGGISKMAAPGGASAKMLAKANGIKNGALRAAATWGIKGGSEIVEEELQNYLEPLYRKIIFGEEYDAPTAEEVAYTAVLTFLTTGVMEAGDIATAALNKPTSFNQTVQEPGALPETLEQVAFEAVTGESAPQEPVQAPVREVPKEADTAAPAEVVVRETTSAPDAAETAKRETDGSEWADIDGKAIREELERRGKEGSPFVEQVMHEAETRAVQEEDAATYGEIGKRALADIVESTNLSEAQVKKQFDTAYELGRMDTPMDKVPLANDIQQTAYNAGRMDSIADMGKNEQPNLENTGKPEYTEPTETAPAPGKKPAQKKKTIRTKKSDWAAHDVTWTLPGDIKHPIAYSTTATSDTIGALADENPTATISELQGLVNYDQEVKRVLQQYIDAGCGDQVANEWFSYDKAHGYQRPTTQWVSGVQDAPAQKEDTNNGEKVAEVSDEGRVLEPDVPGQGDGGLLDGLAAENVQEDARGGGAVPVSEIEGREPAGDAGRPDAQRDGRGRSLGSSEGTDIQPAAGAVKEGENGLEEGSGEPQTGNDATPAQNGDRSAIPEGRAGNRETVQEKPAGVREKQRVTSDAEEYGVAVHFVKPSDWPEDVKDDPAYTSDGEFYVKEGFPARFAEQIIPHEAAHAMLQLGFSSYIDFLDKVPSMVNKTSEYGAILLSDAAEHRGIDLFGEMTEQQVVDLYDELCAMVSNVAVKDIEGDVLDKLRSAFFDYAAYKAELKSIHQQFKEWRKGGSESNTTGHTEAEEVEQKTELATQEQPRGNNFSIPEEGLKLPKGEKSRFKANVEAIKTLRKLMAENRRATPAEQEILSKYVGWGGLANAFDEKKTEWAKEYKQLKNLLSDKEYSSAKGSTLNAHYTDVGVIRAIYNGLSGLGFKGGRLLEPSAGIGHFAGAMPQELAGNGTSWTMVELDDLTGNIAKHLYPNADVRVQGFENAKIPDNYMDMAISNVPFGSYAIVDKTYPKAVTSAIHNYFFAKSLDKVRTGGLVVFITSRYTMDAQDSAVRHYIAQRADLLGAIRLPNSAFKSNAGTEVVTDILVLKKRERGTSYAGENFEKSSWHHTELGIYEQTNDYFAEHPEMVLGKPSSTGGMYRGGSLTYDALPGNLSKQIEKAFASIKGKMDYPVQRTQEEIRAEIKADAGKAKNGQIVKKDGKLYRSQDGVLEAAADIGKATEEALSAIIELRDVGRELLNLQLDDADSKLIKAARKKLNTLYDNFVKQHGILNSQKNKRLVNLDVDAPFILALENYDKETKKATKADIFNKNTISPVKTVTSVNTVEEGLIVSVNETGGVNTARIAELLGESEETVKRALLDNRLAFKNRDGKLETAEKYLSGNVKAKLRDAEALAEGDKDYEANVDELRKIIPADIAAEDISVQPGATWIPDSVYSDFVAETLGSKNYEWRQNAKVAYNKLLGEFNVTVSDAWLKQRPENTSEWGTPDRTFINIFEATLNSKSVTVTRKLEDGSRYVDKQATAAAQEKQEKIRAEFQRWLWADDTRKETMARLYNDVFNNYVTPKYDGSNLTVNGSNADKPLRPHQRDAVQRIINSGGNTLLAHKVGAGKTYEMAAAAMKLRQLGIVKKPMFVVPKSLVAQWGNEFLDFFPAAKILVLGEKDFSAANRKLFANRIATGDYDAVILSQEQFKAVPMSAENQEAFYQEQITALELTMAEAARNNGKRDPSIKQMERSKKSFEAKLKKLADMKKDEDNIDFEQLGVDALFVDEAHSYKNLFYTTNMNNVSGLGNKDGSQKAFDLYMKVRYLQGLNGGRGLVFATATPVMNSMSEMYIMQKYLQSDLLEARGLHSFDAWASQFGEVRTVLEMNPSGKGFRQKQSFSRFKNLAELQQMFRAFADVLTDIPGLKIPTMREGKRIIVESEPSEFQMEFIDKLAERADAIKNRRVKPEEDNMLKVTSEGRKLSYTQRMIDPSLPYEEGNKIMKCAENVLNIWKETKSTKGTQLIFCDLSTPKGSTNSETTTETAEDVEDISIYDDIRNVLIGSGVPAKEIAFIHDANTNDKKAKLFDDVNDGKVRVLIGSTGKMGVGMNAQKRIVALHHLDAPWRPGDIEQREGRALRQGNINDEVGVYVYVTKQTFDSRMWDNLQRKASFIHQVMAGDLTARESEGDGDFALSAAEIKAISSGNPLIMEQFEVAAELSKLENLERAHAKEVADAKKRIGKAKTEIASDELVIARLREDIATRRDMSGDKFKVTIGGKTFTERKAAGEALIAEAKKRLKIVRDTETTTEIGSFAGFKMFVTNGGELLLRGKGQYRASVNMESPAGTAARLEEAVKRMDNMLATAQTRLAENKQAIAKLEKTVASSFGRADELLELRKRNAAILAELNPDDEKNAAELSGDEDSASDFVDNQTGGGNASSWTASRVGDQNKTPMRLSEIVEKIRHDFGINITTGHIRSAGVLGRYYHASQGIRTRIANDLPTVAHELGHHLDNVYDLTGDVNLTMHQKNELIDGLGDGMKANYPEDKWVTEGLAEYIRKYLQNRETAAIDYPEFTKYFHNRLSTSDAALLVQLADEVNAYYSLDADTATSSIRLREEGNPDARTFGEKIKQKASVMYQAWVDANHGIKLYDKATGSNAYTLANNAAYSDAMAGQIIVSDLTDANGQYVAPGLKTALNGINLNNKTEYRLFGEYLTVKHGPERLAEGMRIFADDRKNSTAFMESRAQELEQKYPQFKEAAARLYKFQSQFLQTWGVDTGLVSKESAKEWAKRWEFYVPLNRAVSEGKRGMGAKRGFANQNSTIKKARGSGLDIVHPVDNIINNVVKMVNAGVRNNVMCAITDAASKLGANAEYLEKVPTPLVRRSFAMTGIKEQLHDSIDEALASGELTHEGWDAVDTMIEDIDEIIYQYGKGKAHGDVITVLKKGKQEFWKINDPLLLQSVTTMSPKKMEGILDAYAVVSRFMTANITGNNIIWSLFSNFPRDLMTLFTYSKTKNPVKLFKAMGEAYVNKAGHFGKGLDPLYREYMAMGGSSVSAYTADRNLAKDMRRKLSGKKFTANPLDWIAFASEVVEMGPRYATYKLLREKGMTPQEAFAGAMDITVNFRRGGSIAREMNKVIPFFNVSVQGLDKFRRWITAEDAGGLERKKVVRSRMISYVATSAALAAVFYAINNGDDDEEKDYEQLSNYQKNSYWNIPLGDGKFFAIPKPRELGVLSSFFETAMEYGIGGNDHAFDEFYDYASDNLLPKVASDIAQIGSDGVVETGMQLIGNLGMIGVLGYMGANRDFLGKPIVSSGLQNLEPKDQYTNRTSKIAYWMGQAFDASPMQIDYFFQQVLGGFWKYQKALFPVGGENVDMTLGVQNTYIKDNQYTTDLVNWMYDQADKSSKEKNSNPGDMDAAITAKMDGNMTSFYSKFYGISKDAAETTATRGARQTVLDMILEYQKATDSGYITSAQYAVYDVARQQGSTETLPSVMQTTVTDGNGHTYDLAPAQYVEYQTDYLRLYWEYVETNLDTRASQSEQVAALKAIKEVAKEEALSRTLSRIGAKQTDFFSEYGAADNGAIIDYKAKRDIANDDGSVKQDEVIQIIDEMLRDGLTDAAAYDLFVAEYDNYEEKVDGAQAAGVTAEDFLEFKYNLNNLEYEKNKRNARKIAFRDMLIEMDIDDEAYDYLFSLEYKDQKIR